MSAHGRSAGPRRLELDALTTPRSSVLPFIPTLVTALLIGSVSLLCRHPGAPEALPTDPPAMVSAELPRPGENGLHGILSREASEPGLPATLAFARAYPIVPDAPSERVAATSKQSVARTARSTKRACSGQKCGENHRAEATRYAGDTPRPIDATSSIRNKRSPFRIDPRPPADLPDGALPFAPTADAATRRARAMGNGTACLGASVRGSPAIVL